jgi:hypothetical protein
MPSGLSPNLGLVAGRRFVAECPLIQQARSISPVPLVCQWDESVNPLPRRDIRTPGRRNPCRTLNGDGFDFCGHMTRLCIDVVRQCDEFQHIDVSQILIAATSARTRRVHGLQARVTPMRFRDGGLVRRRRGVTYQVQRYVVGVSEILYTVTFCLPRFLDLVFEEKLITLFHELYHISPKFDGDLRRHDGRYCIHSHSKRLYDEHMATLSREYLGNGADRSLSEFLRFDFNDLQRMHGGVVGVVVPRPKIVPVIDSAWAV